MLLMCLMFVLLLSAANGCIRVVLVCDVCFFHSLHSRWLSYAFVQEEDVIAADDDVVVVHC